MNQLQKVAEQLGIEVKDVLLAQWDVVELIRNRATFYQDEEGMEEDDAWEAAYEWARELQLQHEWDYFIESVQRMLDEYVGPPPYYAEVTGMGWQSQMHEYHTGRKLGGYQIIHDHEKLAAHVIQKLTAREEYTLSFYGSENEEEVRYRYTGHDTPTGAWGVLRRVDAYCVDCDTVYDEELLQGGTTAQRASTIEFVKACMREVEMCPDCFLHYESGIECVHCGDKIFAEPFGEWVEDTVCINCQDDGFGRLCDGARVAIDLSHEPRASVSYAGEELDVLSGQLEDALNLPHVALAIRSYNGPNHDYLGRPRETGRGLVSVAMLQRYLDAAWPVAAAEFRAAVKEIVQCSS